MPYKRLKFPLWFTLLVLPLLRGTSGRSLRSPLPGLLLFPRPVRKPLPELKSTPPVPAQSAVPVEQEFHVLRSAELERELLEFTAAGSNIGARMAMMAITTSNSIRIKRRFFRGAWGAKPPAA